MTGAYLRGVGLCCALGRDAPGAVSALLRGDPAQVYRQPLDELAEPLETSYYRIPDEAELFDPGRFERLLPPVIEAAVSQAGLSAAERRALPVFVGSSCFSVGLAEARYAAALKQASPAALPMPACDYDYPATLARRALGGGGEGYSYNTACTASANALVAAVRMLALGWYPHALVVGAELANRTTLAGFSGLQIIADRVRPFDAERRGLVLGEGIGAVLLSAERQPGDRIRLLGGVNNCDTYSVTTANMDGLSVAAALHGTLAQAGIEPRQVRGIKAHGTGTPTGDGAEAAGMRQVFAALPPVSALKPYLGHTLGACGVIELILFAGALQRGYMPGLPESEAPDPKALVQSLAAPSPAEDGHYLLSQFGFGGSNTVLALERLAS